MPSRLRNSVRRIDGLATGAGVAATVISVFEVIWPTTRGVADNGDFARLTCHLGVLPDLSGGRAPYFRQVNPTWHSTYHASQGVACDYHSPAQRVLELAQHLSWHLPGHHALDLRVVAALYSVGLGLAVGLLVWGLPKHRWVRWVGAGLAVALLTDFDFVGHFTGALSEPLGYVALIAVVGLLLRWWTAKRHPLPLLAALTVASAVLITTKPQYAAVGIPIAIAMLLAGFLGGRGGRLRRSIPGALAAALVLASSFWTLHRQPKSFDPINRYDAFFYGLLPHSHDPARTLRQFGLPARFLRYSGTNWWGPGSGRADSALPGLLPHITIPRMTRYWALHPDEAIEAAVRGTRAGASAHLAYLGKTASTTNPDPNWCGWCPASWTGRQLRSAAPVLMPVAWLASVGAAAWAIRRRRGRDATALTLALAVLSAIAASQLIASLIGEGDYELTKHLFLMTAANVLLVVLGGAAMAGVVADRVGGRA